MESLACTIDSTHGTERVKDSNPGEVSNSGQ